VKRRQTAIDAVRDTILGMPERIKDALQAGEASYTEDTLSDVEGTIRGFVVVVVPTGPLSEKIRQILDEGYDQFVGIEQEFDNG